jgi:hypothetical protein
MSTRCRSTPLNARLEAWRCRVSWWVTTGPGPLAQQLFLGSQDRRLALERADPNPEYHFPLPLTGEQEPESFFEESRLLPFGFPTVSDRGDSLTVSHEVVDE